MLCFIDIGRKEVEGRKDRTEGRKEHQLVQHVLLHRHGLQKTLHLSPLLRFAIMHHSVAVRHNLLHMCSKGEFSPKKNVKYRKDDFSQIYTVR
jgi:hypothetical protein